MKDELTQNDLTMSVVSPTFAVPPKHSMAPIARCATICVRLMLDEGNITQATGGLVAAHKDEIEIGFKGKSVRWADYVASRWDRDRYAAARAKIYWRLG